MFGIFFKRGILKLSQYKSKQVRILVLSVKLSDNNICGGNMCEENLSVFHYCSIEVFCSIMKNYNLRLSDIQKSNDMTERVWIENKIEDQLFKELDKWKISREENGSIVKALKSAKEAFENNSKLYACCFSDNGDMLSQWRCYADESRGLSIGFSKETFEVFNQDLYGIKFAPVCYDETIQNKYAQKQANLILDSILGGRSIIHAVGNVYENKASDYACMKNPMFREENEWRLSISMSPECRRGVQAHFGEGLLSEIKTCCKQDKIITYFELYFKEKREHFIKEVVIGPRCNMSEYELRQILFLWNYDVSKIKVRKSKLIGTL